MASAALQDAADELLERLSDVGIASDDATVEDVLRKAVPARFVRLGAHLASDVAAVVATGCVGVDDREGVDAAVSAIYRSAANAANNPTAAAARLEQGLRRLAAALDADGAAEDEKNAPSSSHVAVAVMSRLVTYVQVGTMLAKRTKRSGPGPETDETRAVDACAVDGDARMDADSALALDPAQAARVSKQLWRVAEGLAADDGVAKALVSSGSRSHDRTSVSHVSQPPDASALLDASLAAARRALRALPGDHLSTAVAGDAAARVVADPAKLATLHAVGDALAAEYATRRETVARRAWLTVQAFGASPRLRNDPEVTRTFSRRAGFGDESSVDESSVAGPSRESAAKRVHDSTVTLNTKANAKANEDDADDVPGVLPLRSGVALRDVWDARVADLARATQRVNAEASRALDASAKRVRIGAVPDRGGRAAVGHGVETAGEKAMPAFAARSADAVKHTGRAGYGGRGGGAGRGGGGRRGQTLKKGGRRGGGGGGNR